MEDQKARRSGSTALMIAAQSALDDGREEDAFRFVLQAYARTVSAKLGDAVLRRLLEEALILVDWREAGG